MTALTISLIQKKNNHTVNNDIMMTAPKLLDEKEQKMLVVELKIIQEEVFEASKNFKELRMEYRNTLFTDFTTENNLKLMLLNEYMEGLVMMSQFHIENRKTRPEEYPSDKDYENYLKLDDLASKPKSMEERYYLQWLSEMEYNSKGFFQGATKEADLLEDSNISLD